MKHMEPGEKIAIVQSRHKGFYGRVNKDVVRIMDAGISLDEKARSLLGVFERMAALFQEFSPCKKGCAHCCHQSLVISEWEAKRIAKYTGKAMTAIPDMDLSAFNEMRKREMMGRYTAVACPFLADNECSIYDVRPMSCRIHVSLADNADPCDLFKQPGASVPYLNMEQAQMVWAILMMSENQSIADIREFFT